MTTERLFIGLTPFEEWKSAREGFVHLGDFHVPLRVYLAGGSVHAYVAAWRYTHDVIREGTRITSVDGSGGHQYVIAPSGALHIVEFDSTAHNSLGLGGQSQIISHERVAITYAPGSWERVTGPWLKDLPEKDSDTRTSPFPPRDERDRPEPDRL